MNVWDIVWSIEFVISCIAYAIGIGITELIFRRVEGNYGEGFCGEWFIAIFSALWPLFWLSAFGYQFIDNIRNRK